MGLDNLVDEKSPDSKSSSSRSSSSSSGSTTSRKSLPEVSFIRNTETDELEVRRYPESIWPDQSFINEKMEFIIEGKDTFRRLKDTINKQAQEDLNDLLKSDPERALKLCRLARGSGEGAKQSAQQTCPVCKQKINPFKDEYERIGEKVIHRNHSVGDLADAGLIGDIEREWDFVESQFRNRY